MQPQRALPLTKQRTLRLARRDGRTGQARQQGVDGGVQRARARRQLRQVEVRRRAAHGRRIGTRASPAQPQMLTGLQQCIR